MSDYYTPPVANVDGETADAQDVNAISQATLAAFDLLEADIDASFAVYDDVIAMAQAWAEHPEDVNIPGGTASDYSAYHWAMKSHLYSTQSEQWMQTSYNYSQLSLANANTAGSYKNLAYNYMIAAQEAALSIGDGNVGASNTLPANYIVVGDGSVQIKSTTTSITPSGDMTIRGDARITGSLILNKHQKIVFDGNT